MILKPSKCIGCPFYDKSEYFTPDHIVPNSKVFFIAQNPGADEEAGHRLVRRNQYTNEYTPVQPQPLIGATGQLFERRFLPLSGLKREEISIGNSIRCRPGSALGLKPDDLPNITTKMKLETSKADIVKALKHCQDAYLQVPSSTELIVTMGRYALFAMTGIQNEESEYGHKQGVVESWRGYSVDLPNYRSFSTIDTSFYHSLTSSYKLFVTMHIAALNYPANKKYFHAVLQDFHKIKLLLNKQWPLPLPTWSTRPPIQWPAYAAFDTEYVPDTNELIRWSLCDVNNNLYCVESGNTNDNSIQVALNSTVLIQNALADIGHLSHIIDISKVNVEDLMLAHSVLWTGEPHSLNYINSMYGAFNRYKHLIHEESQKQLYSVLDAYEPMYSWRNHFIPEFRADAVECEKVGIQNSWQIYKKYRLPLIPIINKAHQTGVKVDTSRLSEIQRLYKDRLQEIGQLAKLATNDNNFYIGGMKRVKDEIYG